MYSSLTTQVIPRSTCYIHIDEPDIYFSHVFMPFFIVYIHWQLYQQK